MSFLFFKFFAFHILFCNYSKKIICSWQLLFIREKILRKKKENKRLTLTYSDVISEMIWNNLMICFRLKKARTLWNAYWMAASEFLKWSSISKYHVLFGVDGTKQYSAKSKVLKQSFKGVLGKRCSENIHQIYRRTPMPKWVLHIFWTPFQQNTSEWLLLKVE